MRALSIARVELVRLFRDRSNIFFVLVFPLLLVVFIGAQFGEGATQTQIAVVDDDGSDQSADLVAALDAVDTLAVVDAVEQDDVVDDVGRGAFAAGLVIPAGYGESITDGGAPALGYVGRPDNVGQSVRSVVQAVVGERAAVVTASRLASEVVDQPVAELAALAENVQGALPGVEVVEEQVGGDPIAQEFAGLGQFDFGASSMLFLFVFLTSLTSGLWLIQTRQLGMARRMLATPTSTTTILVGQAGGRLLVALVQAAYLIVATLLLFGVNWGDPLATGAVVLAFAIVSAAAGMLVGSAFSNDSQAGGIAIGLGLVLAALGGSMMPLEFFPEGMRTVSRFTPHAWANEAMAEIVRHGGGLTDVLPEIGVLAGYAVVLLTVASMLLRRALTR